jgi:hypothetical protein
MKNYNQTHQTNINPRSTQECTLNTLNIEEYNWIKKFRKKKETQKNSVILNCFKKSQKNSHKKKDGTTKCKTTRFDKKVFSYKFKKKFCVDLLKYYNENIRLRGTVKLNKK